MVQLVVPVQLLLLIVYGAVSSAGTVCMDLFAVDKKLR